VLGLVSIFTKYKCFNCCLKQLAERSDYFKLSGKDLTLTDSACIRGWYNVCVFVCLEQNVQNVAVPRTRQNLAEVFPIVNAYVSTIMNGCILRCIVIAFNTIRLTRPTGKGEIFCFDCLVLDVSICPSWKTDILKHLQTTD